MAEGETKVCIKCGQSRPIEDFQRLYKDREIRRSRCRMCRREEYARTPTGRNSRHNGLTGATREERDQIHANYLVELAKKQAIEDAMRARVRDGWTAEANEWVLDALGFGRVSVRRSHLPKNMDIPITFESYNSCDDHFELMGG